MFCMCLIRVVCLDLMWWGVYPIECAACFVFGVVGGIGYVCGLVRRT